MPSCTRPARRSHYLGSTVRQDGAAGRGAAQHFKKLDVGLVLGLLIKLEVDSGLGKLMGQTRGRGGRHDVNPLPPLGPLAPLARQDDMLFLSAT